MHTITLAGKLAPVREYWSPKAAGRVNEVLVKLKGESVWHAHEAEDELGLVIAGTLRMQFRDREVVVRAGDFPIVPQGTEHRPVADEETHVLLVEPASTVNAGTAGGPRARGVERV